MFATQNYIQVVPEQRNEQRKRAREEEEDDLSHGSTSFGEHRNKRLQCLPLRTSPRVTQTFPSSDIITPLNSDLDEPMPRSHFSPWSSSPAFSSQATQDTDMDMADTIQTPPNQQHGFGLSPMAGAEVNHANGRMPTPIQPSFAAQVRGQQGEWAGPGPAVTSLNGVVNMGHHGTGFSDDQCVPRTMATEADWHSLQNNRRLPSPISEGEDSVVCNQAMNSPGMVLDNNFQNQLSTRLENSSLSSPHAMEHPNAMMDVESSPKATETSEDPTTPSPGRRGHIRSRHTINNWTWQPGMKKSLSIGYRADCEKCRLKVPGHFNHIIIS